MQNEVLIRAYKKTRKLIEEEPNNKDNIINEYIDLVQIINDTDINDNNSINPELSKMLKNPLEIAIYNNFQKYNDKYIDDYNTNTNTNTNDNKTDSANFLANIHDLMKNNNL
jgi:hypothetical protein